MKSRKKFSPRIVPNALYTTHMAKIIYNMYICLYLSTYVSVSVCPSICINVPSEPHLVNLRLFS